MAHSGASKEQCRKCCVKGGVRKRKTAKKRKKSGKKKSKRC